MSGRAHWEQVYRTRNPAEVSWFQPEARLSRELIGRLAPGRDSRILDVGAGASVLVDGLLADGYRQVTVLDLSAAALGAARARLGRLARRVTWVEADLLTAALPRHGIDVWHDRAVFHFLTDPADRETYRAQLRHALRPGGLLIMATFAGDGPTRCSGLDVVRYSADALCVELGDGFRLVEDHREVHTTPSGGTQAFTWVALVRLPGPVMPGERSRPGPWST